MTNEPVAVVGIGARMPGGVVDGTTLWRLLDDGVDAIGPVPAGRWDVDRYYSPRERQPGRMNTREGGFLDEVDSFDAQFFGVSERIAEQMDPQQRLLLEVCWETFEDAGIVPADLEGGRAGVFIGASSQDYGSLQTSPGEREGLGAHSATGTFMSILANRLSYTFDLRGPSMTIDTACSSSLVAVHLACESLRRGESDLALAGGVNLLLTPQFGIALSQATMLSPDGRSRAFDASANGYVRGEGAGAVLLKPLHQAQHDGDRVYAVILGSAVNQDGRTQGITVPNGAAQEENFRAAMRMAAVAPDEIGYIEAHGTGTPVGDPIEAGALGRALAADGRRERPAYIGSIKTNIGHLEAGAGIAGLIKSALSVYHRRIPPSLHWHAANPAIDFDELRLAVPTEPQQWPAGQHRAVASVNSFGFGGTNANVVLSGPPRSGYVVHAAAAPGEPTLLTFSARSPLALTRLVSRHLDRLETHPAGLEGLAANLALRRSHHRHRLAVQVAGADDAVSKLRDHLADRSPEGVVAGAARTSRTGKVAFLFNGQGPQWFAMGRTLLETSQVFREKVRECDKIAREYLNWSIYQELIAPDEETSQVDSTHCLQPMMFTVQVALAELWRSWGVVPDVVAGHSMGEIAAAYVSGGLSLRTALQVICKRASIQEKADVTGGMMFVALSKKDAAELCAQHPGELWLAAENSPRASTLSGRAQVLEAVAAELGKRGVFARILQVNCACHSPDMDPLQEELLRELAGVAGAETAVPMYSTVTGERIEGQCLDTAYWWRNFRQPVLFEPAIRAMLADGVDTFVELSPHPVLGNSVRELLADTGIDAVLVSSLSKWTDDWEAFLTAVSQLYTAGRDVSWRRRYPHGAAALELPVNPWIRAPFWNESALSRQNRVGGQPHPMLKRVDGVRPTWDLDWNDHRLAWVTEHDVFGSVIVPGAAYLEAALAAAREITGEACALEYVEFERACVLGEEAQISRLELDPVDGTFEFHQRAVRGMTWTRNARGRYHRGNVSPDEPVDLDVVRARCDDTHRAVDIYARFQQRGYAYGRSFCGIKKLYVGRGEALARVQVPRVLKNRLQGYLFHPAVLDACFQSAILQPTENGDDELLPFTYLPTGIDRVRVYGELPPVVWCHTRAHKHDGTGLSVDVRVLDEHGRLLAEFAPLHGKVVRQAATGDDEDLSNDFYRFGWQASPLPGTANAPGHAALTEGPARLRADLEPARGALAARLGRHEYATGYQDAVRQLCAAYVAQAVRAFGCELSVGATFTDRDFTELLPRYHRAFTGFLRFLVEDGVLSEHADRYRVERTADCSPEALWAETMARYPSCVWELLLLRRTGTRLHEVLVGRAEALELLFPSGSGGDAEAVYQSSPIARFYNLLVKKAVERLAHTADRRRTLRVLEVGGGTGGLTAGLLPVLPPDRCEYVFTDVSTAFVERARERFRGHEFVEYQTLDLESDPRGQAIAGRSFDIVVAADVVHATADLKLTLMRLQELLVPGGVLALVEALPGNRWLDLTFGLTTGWWSFRDLRLRPDGPLLPAGAWENLLSESGYEEVTALGDPGHEGAGAQTVLLGRAPATEPVGVAPADPHQAGSQRRGDWVLFTGGDELGAALAAGISEWGERAILVRHGESFDNTGDGEVTVRPGHSEDYDRLLALCEPAGIIQLCDTTPDTDRAGDQAAVQVMADLSLSTDIAQALSRLDEPDWPRVYLLTRGTQSFRNDTIRPHGAAVWGFATVAGLELPRARHTVIDLDALPTPGETEAVLAELRGDENEREIVLRAGERFVRRLVPLPPESATAPTDARDLPDGRRFALDMAAPGTLDGLRYVGLDRVAPAPGQVEVRVVAAGLNFLDVMTALGQVPPLDSAPDYRFGAECSGIVTRVGAGVADVQVGDPVMVVSAAQGALASHVTVDAAGVVAKPASLSFEDAATVPVVFLTAWYALRRLARIVPGERVLIHSAAGGTGLAALQIATLAGAEVFATAGTPEKRALLRSLGVQHVLDSRSLDFADQIRQATGGAGVDVVLNSIAGQAAERSLACLAPYGRFVELGKRDLLDDGRLGLRPFLQNLAYFGFDLRQLLVDRPELVRAELDELRALFAEGRLRPLPHRVFHPSQAEDAFRQLAAANHIGKLVLALDEPEVPITADPEPGLPGATGTWLITGGFGGVGLAMADELANAGVDSLVLLGRSGASTEHAKARVKALRDRGVRVFPAAVDITARTELSQLLIRIARDLPPLRGVLHCAMVLDDVLLTELDAERLSKVLAPKMLGAWHLHELTAHLPLESFVLFSSATSMIGNVGQANYGAANAFLDQLAEARRAQGLPALAINWGAVSDAGYVSRHDDIGRHVATTGMRGFTAAQAFRAMARLHTASLAQVGVLPMDWPRFFRHHGLDPATQPRYEHLAGAGFDRSETGGDPASGGSLAQRVRAHDSQSRDMVLRAGLKTRVAGVLGLPLDDLDEDMPLMNYLDSLLAVEISAWIERELGTKVTIMELMKGPSISQLATQMSSQLDKATAG